MADEFFDTSALVKHYHLELGSDVVDRLILEPSNRCFISRLGLLEIQIVFAAKVRAGLIADADFELYRRRLFADITRRRLRVVRVLGRHFQDAERLARRLRKAAGLRTLDAIQLVVALSLKAQGALDHIVCSDNALCQIAALEQLPVIDPEQP
jgi:hypothetical protein